jgi:hypothetical protein
LCSTAAHAVCCTNAASSWQTDVLRKGIVGSQDRQARLRATMSDNDYKVFCKVMNSLTNEANKMLIEAKDNSQKFDR